MSTEAARRWHDLPEDPLPAGTYPGVVAMNDRMGLVRCPGGRLRPQLLEPPLVLF